MIKGFISSCWKWRSVLILISKPIEFSDMTEDSIYIQTTSFKINAVYSIPFKTLFLNIMGLKESLITKSCNRVDESLGGNVTVENYITSYNSTPIPHCII
jgi:hypothetical protein